MELIEKIRLLRIRGALAGKTYARKKLEKKKAKEKEERNKRVS